MIWPGVLRFMGSQRVGHDWATDLIWSESPSKILQFYEWTFFEVFSYSWFYLVSWTPRKEVRSLVFYTWGAGPQRGRLVCPKSPWICVRACVRLWLSFSGPLSLLLGCLPQCLQCPQRLWCQQMLWMPFSWVGPLAWRERNSGWDLTSQDCLPGGEQVEEFTRPKQGSCWLQIILLSLIESGARLWS